MVCLWVIDNIISTRENLKTLEAEKYAQGLFEYFDKITVDLIISPFYDKSQFITRMNTWIDANFKDQVDVYYRRDIEEQVQQAYNKIDDIPRSRE